MSIGIYNNTLNIDNISKSDGTSTDASITLNSGEIVISSPIVVGYNGTSTIETSGMLRWSGTSHEGYNGTTWEKLNFNTSDARSSITSSGYIDYNQYTGVISLGTAYSVPNIGTNVGQILYWNGTNWVHTTNLTVDDSSTKINSNNVLTLSSDSGNILLTGTGGNVIINTNTSENLILEPDLNVIINPGTSLKILQTSTKYSDQRTYTAQSTSTSNVNVLTVTMPNSISSATVFATVSGLLSTGTQAYGGNFIGTILSNGTATTLIGGGSGFTSTVRENFTTNPNVTLTVSSNTWTVNVNSGAAQTINWTIHILYVIN